MNDAVDDWLIGSGDGDETSSGFSDFQNRISDWGNSMQEKARQNRQESAKGFGRLAEKGAGEKGSAAGKKGAGNSSFMSAVQNARDAENKDGFANNVQGKTLEQVAAKSIPGGKMFVNQAKKFGPAGTILIIVAALMGVFAGTQSLAPFGLVANGLDQFNNLRTSMNRRNTYFRRFSLDKSRNTPITKKATIFSAEKFKVSNGLSKKLAKQNIHYVDMDGMPRFLIYEDQDTGKTYAIAANDNDASRLPSGGIDIEVDGEMRHFEISPDARLKIDDALIDSNNFLRALDVGTRTLKGHVAGWFDDLSEFFHLNRIKSSRNKFKDAPDTATDEDIQQRARTADQGMDESIRASNSEAKEDDGRNVADEDGDGTHWEEDIKDVENDTGVDKESTRGMNPADIEGRVKSDFELKAKNMAGAMGSGANLACMALKIYSAFNAIIAGVQVANIVNYVTGFLEAIQKTQAGDAGKNELAYYMNSLSEKGDTYGSSLASDTSGDYDAPVKSGTSSLESPAWNQFFSSGSVVVQADDPVALKFNREYTSTQSISNAMNISGGDGWGSSIVSAIGALGSSADAYKACLYIDAAAQGLGLFLDIGIDIILAAFTGGVGTVIKNIFQELIGSIWKTVALGAITTAITSIFMSFLPQIAQWMAMDLIGNMAGEDAAYAINSGFNIYLGGQMQVSSGLPATEEKLMAHWRAQQEVIAEEAEFERSQRSPFDPTSKYTFLGSIVNSLMPIANTWSSPLTTISKTVNTVGTSLMGLRPTANAEGEAKFETSLNYDCPNLSKIGAVGDAYCNPYFVTDMDTMAKDPSDVIDAVSLPQEKGDNPQDGNFLWNDPAGEVDTDGDGVADAYNPTINPQGELAKWVIACPTRDSGFGIVDSNVMNSITQLRLTGNEALDNAVQTGMGWIPIVGDIAQIKDDFTQAAEFGWATGQNCLSDEYKYYSRYSEDQRMLESMGLIEQSSVVAFLEDYYEKNPIDTSWEGTIARYSGMTKEDVEETLAWVEFFEWLAEYNPENYGPEKFEPKGDGSYQYESNEIVAQGEQVVVGRYIIYDDLRTKTKIA